MASWRADMGVWFVVLRILRAYSSSRSANTSAGLESSATCPDTAGITIRTQAMLLNEQHLLWIYISILRASYPGSLQAPFIGDQTKSMGAVERLTRSLFHRYFSKNGSCCSHISRATMLLTVRTISLGAYFRWADRNRLRQGIIELLTRSFISGNCR